MTFDLETHFGHAAAWPHGEDHDHPLTIAIAGGSGSGKTTIAQSVVDIVGSEVVARLPHDAYYRRQEHLSYEERTRINYDHPDSLENELFVEHIDTLRSGRAIERPVYDFSNHTRASETVHVESQPVILVEGILVLAEPEIRERMDLRIYIDTDSDLRLMRRL
ncbi:MAG: uridine kinase, partial [Actinomycetota bacterium]|nr:uridine kinase [Actinomycetota bacterium]